MWNMIDKALLSKVAQSSHSLSFHLVAATDIVHFKALLLFICVILKISCHHFELCWLNICTEQCSYLVVLHYSAVWLKAFRLLLVLHRDVLTSANISSRGRDGKVAGHADLWSPHASLNKVLACHIYVHSFFLLFLSGSCASCRTVKPLTAMCHSSSHSSNRTTTTNKSLATLDNCVRRRKRRRRISSVYCPQHVAWNQGSGSRTTNLVALQRLPNKLCHGCLETFFEVVWLPVLLCNARVTLQGALVASSVCTDSLL